MKNNLIKSASGCLTLAILKIGKNDLPSARKQITLAIVQLSRANQPALLAQIQAIGELIEQGKGGEATRQIGVVQAEISTVLSAENADIGAHKSHLTLQKVRPCPKCGDNGPENAKFCGGCGISLIPPICPNCKHAGPPGANFCGECGRKL